MPTDSVDRPATLTDVVITPAMIEAGVEAMVGYDMGWEPLSDRVVAVFIAMIRSGRRSGDLKTPAADSAR